MNLIDIRGSQPIVREVNKIPKDQAAYDQISKDLIQNHVSPNTYPPSPTNELSGTLPLKSSLKQIDRKLNLGSVHENVLGTGPKMKHPVFNHSLNVLGLNRLKTIDIERSPSPLQQSNEKEIVFVG